MSDSYKDEPLEITLNRIDSNYGRTYRKGNYLCNQGEWGDTLFIIRNGRVKIFQEMNEVVVSSYILSSGDIFGEMSIIDPKPRYASAMALEDTFALILGKNEFLHVVRKNPIFSIKIMQTLAKIIRRIDEELDIVRSGNMHLFIVHKISELIRVKCSELGKVTNIIYSTKELMNIITKSTNLNSGEVRICLEKLNMQNILEWNENEIKLKEAQRMTDYERSLKRKQGIRHTF